MNSKRDPLTLLLCRLLHDIRIRLDLKPRDVAEMAGFTVTTYYNMERGTTHCSLDLYIQAFKAMKIHPSLALLAAESVANPQLPLRIDMGFLLANRMP